jgi:TPP-dependent 2-oxoacid decarboxylase
MQLWSNVSLKSCGLLEKIVIAEMQLKSNILFKSCGFTVPSSCGIVIAVTRFHL